MQSAYVNVACIKRLPRSLGLFTYAVTTDLPLESLIGQWARVPFRGRMVDGVIWGGAENIPKHVIPQPIGELLPHLPYWTKGRRDFVERFAREQWISISHALDVMVPQRPKRNTVPHDPALHSPQGEFLRIHKQREQEIAEVVKAWKVGVDPQSYFLPVGSFAERIVAMLHVSAVLPAEQQACILVPTHEELQRCARALRLVLGSRLVVLDSTSPMALYWETWLRAAHEKNVVILTTKRGIFAPFANLGALLVDLETDHNHRQADMNPRYDAREVAEWIAEQHHATRILLDAVPTLQTYCDTTVIQTKQPPNIQQRYIVDRMLEPHGGYEDVLAPRVSDVLRESTASAVLFVNRRGAAKSLYCGDCGWTAKCPPCDAPYSITDDVLLCYRCGSKTAIPLQCGTCSSVRLKMRGVGVQHYAKKLQQALPHRRLIVLEGTDIPQVIPPGTLIVATEKLFTLTSLPPLEHVVFPDVDTLLRYPAFATYEMVYCLAERVCALASNSARIYIQTRDSAHPVVRALAHKNPTMLYEIERTTRKTLHLPPEVNIIKLTYTGKRPGEGERKKKELATVLSNDPAVTNDCTVEELQSPTQRGRTMTRPSLVLRSLSAQFSSATLEHVRILLADAWVVEQNPESLNE